MFSELYKEHPEYFIEEPVSIQQFINDEKYLGKYTDNGMKIYPFWKEVFRQIFPLNKNIEYNNILFTGAIATGKTIISSVLFLFTLHNYLCLKSPQDVFKLPGFDFCFTVYSKSDHTHQIILDMIHESEWLSNRLNLKYIDVKNCSKYLMKYRIDNCILLSLSERRYKMLDNRCVNCAIINDEAQIPNVDLQSSYSDTEKRFGKFKPLLYISNTGKYDSRMEFIYGFKKTMNSNSFVVDKPIWEIVPKHKCFKPLTIAYNESQCVILDEPEELRLCNWKIINVSEEFSYDFEKDPKMALIHWAGKNPFYTHIENNLTISRALYLLGEYKNSYIINTQDPENATITFADRNCSKLKITRDGMSCVVDTIEMSVTALRSGYFRLYARYED